MQTVIIAALDEERGIGKDNALPWRISEDLKRFKALTMGNPIIMGRKTHQSIGRPLPGRTNIVITRDEGFQAAGCTVVHSLEQAQKAAKAEKAKQVFVIGGAEIYRSSLPEVDRLELTLVDGFYEADAFFPEYEDDFVVTKEESSKDDLHQYRFVTLERKK
nr:Dihydrofolate reductase [uncultured bacterium]